MLDSQNDTIAGLKKELVEAKDAARGSASSIKARDANWMNRLQDEVEQVYMNIISDPDLSYYSCSSLSPPHPKLQTHRTFISNFDAYNTKLVHSSLSHAMEKLIKI
jgi:hypothetical protein